MVTGKYKDEFKSHGYVIEYEAEVRAKCYSTPDTPYLSNGDPGYPGDTEYYDEEMVDYEATVWRDDEDTVDAISDEELVTLVWLDDEVRKHCEDCTDWWEYD